MAQDQLTARLSTARDYFLKTISNLDEADSGFVPAPEMMTAAQQVAHTAQTVDWFVEGAFHNGEAGMDMDFAGHAKDVMTVTSLAAAREWLNKAFARAIEEVGSKSDADLDEKIGGQIMGGMARRAIIGGIIDHTAHHRGALSVYTRLCGKIPPMPYM